MRYEIWETFQHDSCIEKVALVGTASDCYSATAIAVQCRRPDIEIYMPETRMWLSHLVSWSGLWIKAFGSKRG